MNLPDTSCRAALLTPPGEGGIGVIVLDGRGAVPLAQAMFRARRPAELGATPGRLHYGHLLADGEVLDEVLVCVVPGEGGGQRVEINCHGGIVAVERVLAELRRRGAQVLHGDDLPDASLDAVQREAAIAIPRARSRLAVRMLLEQYRGGLSRELRAIVMLEAADAAARIDRLLACSRLGLALCSPPRLVIAGSTNTGKSSLFNALIGQARAIVTEVPGTTRDFLTDVVAIGDVPFELVDTAGLRETDHLVEIEGIRCSREQISRADVVLLLMEAGRPPTRDELRLHAELEASGVPLVAVLNKIDLLPAGTPPAGADARISALTGAGLPDLEARIVEAAVGALRYDGGPMAFTRRQVDLLGQAGVAVAAGGDCRPIIDAIIEA